MTSKWGRTACESISRHRPFRWMHLLKTQSTTYNTGINAQTHAGVRAHATSDNHLALMRAPRRNYTVAQIRRASRCGLAPHLLWSHIKNKMSCVWIALWFDCHRPQTLIHYRFLISNVPEFKKLIMIFVYLFVPPALGSFGRRNYSRRRQCIKHPKRRFEAIPFPIFQSYLPNFLD